MGPEDQEHPEDADGHGDCRREIARLRALVVRAGKIFQSPGAPVRLGGWNWPVLAAEFLREADPCAGCGKKPCDPAAHRMSCGCEDGRHDPDCRANPRANR